MKIVVLGSPGVGKGTYTQDLVKIYNLEHVASGELFRQNMEAETELGLKAKEFIDQGELVPDEITIGMMKNKLTEIGEKGFILDGILCRGHRSRTPSPAEPDPLTVD